MGKVEIILPKMGESVAEATVTSWCFEVGDQVEAEDALLEIATDKVDSEVPSTHSGKLIEKRCEEGDVVAVGSVVAVLEIDGEEAPKNDEFEFEDLSEKSDPEVKSIEPQKEIVENSTRFETADTKRFYSPLVKSIAKREGISLEALENIPGTGLEGRLTKNDLLKYIEQGIPTKIPSSSSNLPKTSISEEKLVTSSSTPSIEIGASDEVIEMDRIRKLISKHMVHSKQVAPHVTSFVEADVTNIVKWRNKIKDSFTQQEGFKITFTPVFIEAVSKALKDFPMVNISVDGENIIKKKNINIGMAVALPSGNLIVPVVKNADQLNLRGLAGKVNELSLKARNNKLSQDDVKGGTFTVTNAGTFGNVMGTPIINQPEVAILATGVIQKKPAVLETPEGDVIAIRHKMFLSLSYDHRVVDGMLGGSFLRRIADYLEKFEIDRQI
jgi:2-oxoglutarate dehydrogenase E2 component (dihydrolipoamide succinyltransferase)